MGLDLLMRRIQTSSRAIVQQEMVGNQPSDDEDGRNHTPVVTLGEALAA